MKTSSSFAVLISLAAALVAPRLPAAPEADAAAGRALVKRYADAIIGIELVVTLKVKVGEREMAPDTWRDAQSAPRGDAPTRDVAARDRRLERFDRIAQRLRERLRLE